MYIKIKSLFIWLIYVLIVLNIICLVLESFKTIREEYHNIFYAIELISILIFTIEYFIRLFLIDLENNSNSKRRIGITYALSNYGIIDLLSLLPFYLPLLFPFDLRVVRALRLFRLARVFKLGRYSKSFRVVNDILKETRSELLITVFIAFVLLGLSSTLIFYAENAAQPEKFSSIVDAFWWSLSTLTTVGYEETRPITSLGKFLSGLIGVIGIGFVALPTGIFSSALIDKVKSDTTCSTCPNCGEEL